LLGPADVVAAAQRYGSRSVAYTYTEPTAFYEYMLDTAKLVKKAGLRNIMISCGYINPDPLREISEWMDVVKIDLKGFRKSFFRLAATTLTPGTIPSNFNRRSISPEGRSGLWSP
jgi:pyruvate formate lyase activating enzyme